MKHLTDLDQCTHEAIEYDENCDPRNVGPGSQASQKTTAKVSSQVDKTIRGVTKRMKQLYRPLRTIDRCMDRPYICGICGKNHPTSQFVPKN